MGWASAGPRQRWCALLICTARRTGSGGFSLEYCPRQHSLVAAGHRQGLQKAPEPCGLPKPVLQLRSWDYLHGLLLTTDPGLRTELLFPPALLCSLVCQHGAQGGKGLVTTVWEQKAYFRVLCVHVVVCRIHTEMNTARCSVGWLHLPEILMGLCPRALIPRSQFYVFYH